MSGNKQQNDLINEKKFFGLKLLYFISSETFNGKHVDEEKYLS